MFMVACQTLRAIYTSPSSATGPKAKKTKRGNAALLKLDVVTPEMISCAALQVCLCSHQHSFYKLICVFLKLRFALCSMQDYANVDGLFNFEEFYHFVLDSIYAGLGKEGNWGADLFAWWNA